MEQSILNLQHLTKSFDGKKILDDLSIDIERNEFVTLLGPSGCGKTTTLRIIGGFATPDEGKVIFEGKDITNLSPDKRHINTRNHDLLGLGIAKIEYIVNHITFFILDDTVLLSYINDCTKLLLGHDALGIALSYSKEENDSE